jgi:pyruvate,water dikinase
MEIVSQEVAVKRKHSVYSADSGVSLVPLPPALSEQLSLPPEQARELARQLVTIEEHFGVPQDVEWALAEDDSLVILQCRPLTQRDHIEDAHTSSPEADEHRDAVLLEGTVTACPGGAAGPVYVVRQERDVVTFPEDAVLVASQPLPDWAAVMRRAAAVICEQGSLAGHLANVARELQVPAVFGCEGATRRLANGRLVTVAASRKTVYDGEIGDLITRAREFTHPVQTSPIYRALEGAAQHIVPLRLLDPDDKSKFTPEGCTSLHDITRLCHECALREVFGFGAEHSFPERQAKRLYAGAPTQFWVIDLADGFADSARGNQTVDLGEIRSLPMHALWRGMMTIPWQSPPVHAGGLLEVLMRSTSDPGLNPSMPSPYAERNYFMVTQQYCSCKTRFGYHFSTVEALVGADRRENYVSFNFRGGAAGERRRARRARLISDILAEHDFRVHTVGDSVHARLEKYREDYLVPRLEVIGYLMFHTRQLDMVLTDRKAMRRYRSKFRTDIAHLLELTAQQR